MGRKSSVGDAELLRRLGAVFRDIGYDGATLSTLAGAAGLHKASLYHRFPGGKEQMAEEVLQHTGKWLEANLLAPLRAGSSAPAERIAGMVRGLNGFYSGGEQDCLLNVLSMGRASPTPFGATVKEIIEAFVSTLSSVLVEAGIEPPTARIRAQRAMVGLQGSLVVSRGLGTTRPFRTFLKELPEELLLR